ncbi:MAG: aspartate kinase [Burkholderiales bacterium]|nr:aspartate kinase [Burkholderiales bacterium]
MWVVKLGGSLNADLLLPRWLALLGGLGGGRVAVVAGGGEFADTVRAAQGRWRFDDLAAHNMAVLAMAQTTLMMSSLEPALQLASQTHEITQVLQTGRTALWWPLEALRPAASADTSWDVSSDSLALALARRLNAERLVLVKSCEVAPGDSLDALSAAGIVDARFPHWAREVDFPIDVVSRSDIDKVRAGLLSGR